MFIGGLNWETTDGKIVYSYNLYQIVSSIVYSIKVFILIIKKQNNYNRKLASILFTVW